MHNDVSARWERVQKANPCQQGRRWLFVSCRAKQTSGCHDRLPVDETRLSRKRGPRPMSKDCQSVLVMLSTQIKLVPRWLCGRGWTPADQAVVQQTQKPDASSCDSKTGSPSPKLNLWVTHVRVPATDSMRGSADGGARCTQC